MHLANVIGATSDETRNREFFDFGHGKRFNIAEEFAADIFGKRGSGGGSTVADYDSGGETAERAEQHPATLLENLRNLIAGDLSKFGNLSDIIWHFKVEPDLSHDETDTQKEQEIIALVEISEHV